MLSLLALRPSTIWRLAKLTTTSAREFYDIYLEARADPTLDARDLQVETLNFEARDYLDYIEAREADTVSLSG
jgi:hypothetical protein